MVKLLLGLSNINIDPKDCRGRIPLSWATQQGYKKAIQLLIDKGTDIYAKDNLEKTLLSWATREGYDEVIRLLAEQGRR
jgi:ankyrin repeat protein